MGLCTISVPWVAASTSAITFIIREMVILNVWSLVCLSQKGLILSHLFRHPNITTYWTVFTVGSWLWVISPFMAYGKKTDFKVKWHHFSVDTIRKRRESLGVRCTLFKWKASWLILDFMRLFLHLIHVEFSSQKKVQEACWSMGLLPVLLQESPAPTQAAASLQVPCRLSVETCWNPADSSSYAEPWTPGSLSMCLLRARIIHVLPIWEIPWIHIVVPNTK